MKSSLFVPALLLSAAAVVSVVYPASSRAESNVHYGASVEMGNGTVRTYLALDADGKPLELGVLMDADALEGLPTGHNTTGRCFDLNGNGRIDETGECEGDYEYILDLPRVTADRFDIPFQWVGLNWNAHGHAPPDIYDLAHIDFHFYIANEASVRAIRVGSCGIFIHCDDFKRATQPVPPKYVDIRQISVGAAVGQMGDHLIDTTSPEFAKPPKKFTHTWIVGAYDGRITFYEPMVTHEFLKSRANVCAPVKQPAAWQISGWYPTRYCIRYHPRVRKHTISMEGLEYRKAS